MITVNLIPWPKLVRGGVPEFRIARQPLTLNGTTYQQGEMVPHSAFRDRTRLRQMYEQRRIEPAQPVPGMRNRPLAIRRVIQPEPETDIRAGVGGEAVPEIAIPVDEQPDNYHTATPNTSNTPHTKLSMRDIYRSPGRPGNRKGA